MLNVVHINGPINSGKSTLGRNLAGLLSDAVFIDGDDHDAPDDAPLNLRIQAAMKRIETCIEQVQAAYLVVAYPLDKAGYQRLKAVSNKRGARLVVVTLAPPLAVALSNRGKRILSGGERARIAEMYEEGYHARSFSDVVLDTSSLTPSQSAEQIAALLLSRAA